MVISSIILFFEISLQLWTNFLFEDLITETTLGTGNVLIFLMAFVVKIYFKCRRKWKYWLTPLLLFLITIAKYDHLKHQSEWKMLQRNFCCETFKLSSNFSQLAHSRGKFLRILLLLSGNVESNPGPVSHYTLDNADLCGFYSAAIYSIFNKIKLIPLKQGVIETAKEEEGIAVMVHIFGQHFSVHQLDFVKIKNIARFLKTNKKWSKGRSKDDEDKYYSFFSTVNWDLLDDQTKEKHTIDCEECKKYPVHSTCPSATNKTKESHKQIQETLIDVKCVLDQGLNDLQEKKMKTCNSFTDGLSQLMDEQFSTHFKVTFQDRYEKNRNLAEKRKYEDKRKERGTFGREILNNIKKQKMSTQVERLYGSEIDLRRIVDFLSFGENIWWEKNDFSVEFFDVPENQVKLGIYISYGKLQSCTFIY